MDKKDFSQTITISAIPTVTVEQNKKEKTIEAGPVKTSGTPVVSITAGPAKTPAKKPEEKEAPKSPETEKKPEEKEAPKSPETEKKPEEKEDPKTPETEKKPEEKESANLPEKPKENMPVKKGSLLPEKKKESALASLRKGKIPQKINEFQPDALEIKNQQLPRMISFCVWFPVLAVVLGIIWACLAEVDVVVQGTGKLTTDMPTIVMKPLERSVIESVNVKIGDVVKKDQILITFDPAFNAAEAERLMHEIEALEAQLARLQAEFRREKFDANKKQQFAVWQSAIFEQRAVFFNEKIKYYDEALLQIDATKKNKQDNLAKQRERLEAVGKLENMFKRLHERNAASLKELIQMQITRMEMEATVDQIANDLLELDHQRGTTLAAKNSFIQEWLEQISEEMVNVDRNLTSTRKQFEKASQYMAYVYLRAPCDAVVHEIAAFSPGSAVREAEALITLIPMTGRLRLEAEVRPEDISKVKIGAQSRVKVSAFPFQKHGTLDGTVVNISYDTLSKNEGAHAMPYYRVLVSVSGKLHGVKDGYQLIPGMQCQCEIKCGRRRVIEFILYPLIKALDEAAREP